MFEQWKNPISQTKSGLDWNDPSLVVVLAQQSLVCVCTTSSKLEEYRRELQGWMMGTGMRDVTIES